MQVEATVARVAAARPRRDRDGSRRVAVPVNADAVPGSEDGAALDRRRQTRQHRRVLRPQIQRAASLVFGVHARCASRRVTYTSFPILIDSLLMFVNILADRTRIGPLTLFGAGEIERFLVPKSEFSSSVSF